MNYNGKYDFCGWATKNNLKCSDGRIIRKDAFKVNDGQKVPLVWNHDHNDPSKVLGHAILFNTDEGVYAYGVFNDTQKGKDAKEIVQHGDVASMSIWANELDQVGSDVLHGNIREVSLVLAGANPGAFVESVMSHGEPMDEDDVEGIFYTGEGIILAHSEESKEETKKKDDSEGSKDGKTVKEIYNDMSEEQKMAVASIVMAFNSGEDEENKKEEEEMKHNIFDTEGSETAMGGRFLSHSELAPIFEDAKKCGSLRAAISAAREEGGILAHAIDTTGMTVAAGSQDYGFNDPEMLFPEYKNLSTRPEWLKRDMGWVSKVMSGVHRTPFSRIKSMYANITEDDARARGYIKGNQKKTEVFTTLKRTTDPQTIYKLQKMDRDDILDITDFDVVAWIREEMRFMLDEEIARAILIGDGRDADSEDKIQEAHIRPIVTDVPLFNVTVLVKVAADATEEEIAKAIIKEMIRSRKYYKGSGNPTFWTTEDVITEMLLIEDGIGHRLYKTEGEVATTLRVRDIVTVEPMENHKVTYNNKQYPLIGVNVNLTDYNVGADKRSGIEWFEDFDIDFNKYSYLIETRMSGALVRPYSAITFLLDKAGSAGGSSPVSTQANFPVG